MENMQKNKRSVSWAMISIIIALVALGGYIFVTADNGETSSVTSANTTSTEYLTYRGSEIIFNYPRTFSVSTTTEDLPEELIQDIYVSPLQKENEAGSPQITVSVYANEVNLTATDFIEEMRRRSVIVLPGILEASLEDSYSYTDRTINGTSRRQYTNTQTNERTAFYAIKNKMIIVSEQGTSKEIQNVYDVILQSFQGK